MAITTRETTATGVTNKGAPLTNAELDNNFVELKQNKVETGLATLDAISTSIADTAVDVFVYDTRKDSDGGAWRKRCQHTSWYNETLNTATRGSRKEFPAVAVIVLETNTLTIYDGDDPSLPMWMVWNGTSLNAYIAGWRVGLSTASSRLFAEDATTVTASNGYICAGHIYVDEVGTTGIRLYNFINEVTQSVGNNYQTATARTPFADRNEYKQHFLYLDDLTTSGRLVNSNVNDVAMTVLPNASINPCFVGDTLVTMADGSSKRIDSIEVGEIVKTLEGESRVVNFFNNGDKPVYRYTFDNGASFVCTKDHLIRTTNGWVEAGKLSEDDEVIGL
jgi:hypothetical protein